MQYLKIAIHLAVLYGIFRVGQFIQDVFDLFIPGSVIGMVLLFVLLMTNSLNVRWIEEGTQFMIRHLNLFFIPATVGIMDYFHVFAGKGILLIFIVLSSTVLVMSGAGFVSEWLMPERGMEHE
ncbi:MAG TPA: CidA/LrgA family protein [Bacillota bacterium]|nr:CidA/LrgA family protein [Bacillota bacterium]